VSVFPWAVRHWNVTLRRILPLCTVLVLAGIAAPAGAGEFWQSGQPCYWCVRDAIYDDFALIARLEANPDIDEGFKGPQITAARADIHRLRATLGPPEQTGTEPCCYSRRPLFIR
jgi:hypothetical protein